MDRVNNHITVDIAIMELKMANRLKDKFVPH